MDFLSHDDVRPTDVANLLTLCFGPARHKRTAALLRAGAERVDGASFVALSGDELVGSVEVHELEWQHPMGTGRLLLLGPLVSHPAWRGKRIGVRLMDLAIAEVDKLQQPTMLIGDEPFYGRWGFAAQHTAEWILPGPVDRDRLLLRASAGHRLRGPAIIRARLRASAAA